MIRVPRLKPCFGPGNVGSFMGNVNISLAQGQMAGFMVGEEMEKEDMGDLGSAALDCYEPWGM